MKPVGQAPITPDTPFDEAAYDAVIAAMDEMIAQGKELKANALEKQRADKIQE